MSIFISYRRSSLDIVGRIHDWIERELGVDSVFQDVEDLEPGSRFLDQIERAIEEAQLVMAVIGPDWVQPRLRDPSDVLRQELELALNEGIPIVPLTLNTTSLPDLDGVPTSLRPVFEYQSYVVRSGGEFGPTMERLVEALRPRLGGSKTFSGPADAGQLTRDEWYDRARSHAALGERDEALTCLLRAIELDPGFGAAHGFRGTILLLEGRQKEAIVAFRSALAVNPDDGESQVGMASALSATGELREAKWWMEKTLRLERPPREEGMVRGKYAGVLLELGMSDAAIEQFDLSLRLVRDEAPPDVVGFIHQQKGEALATGKRFREALVEYDAALEYAGPNAQLANDRGLAELGMGRPQEARRAFLEGLELVPDAAALHYNLAIALGREGEEDAALSSLSRALSLNAGLRATARADDDLAALRETAEERFEQVLAEPRE